MHVRITETAQTLTQILSLYYWSRVGARHHTFKSASALGNFKDKPGLTPIGAVVLEEWSLDRLHQHHLEACSTCKFQVPPTSAESKALGLGPSNLPFIGPQGILILSEKHYSRVSQWLENHTTKGSLTRGKSVLRQHFWLSQNDQEWWGPEERHWVQLLRGAEVPQSSFGGEVRTWIMILRVKAEEMVRKWWECVWSVCCRPLAANRGRKLELRLEVAFKFMQRGFLFVFLLGEKQKPVNKQTKNRFGNRGRSSCTERRVGFGN